MFSEQISVIKETAQAAGNYAGVYKMLDDNQCVIYVGKAKNLHNRLMSYTRIQNMPNRIKMMVSKIKNIEFVITVNEKEALILESNLIKQLKPYFNVLMRDDKTYPYIFIDENSDKHTIYRGIDHIKYIADKIGIDHIGLGFDYNEYFEDDETPYVKGLENASKSYDIINLLKDSGFNNDEIMKIEYGNFHRVIKEIM